MPDLRLTGWAAPPRTNGELVFDAPWQARAFGAAVALHEQGRLPWGRFVGALSARTAIADPHGVTGPVPAGSVPAAPADVTTYWQAWSSALEEVVGDLGISTTLVDEREQAYARRPDGHDHRH